MEPLNKIKIDLKEKAKELKDKNQLLEKKKMLFNKNIALLEQNKLSLAVATSKSDKNTLEGKATIIRNKQDHLQNEMEGLIKDIDNIRAEGLRLNNLMQDKKQEQEKEWQQGATEVVKTILSNQEYLLDKNFRTLLKEVRNLDPDNFNNFTTQVRQLEKGIKNEIKQLRGDSIKSDAVSPVAKEIERLKGLLKELPLKPQKWYERKSLNYFKKEEYIKEFDETIKCYERFKKALEQIHKGNEYSKDDLANGLALWVRNSEKIDSILKDNIDVKNLEMFQTYTMVEDVVKEGNERKAGEEQKEWQQGLKALRELIKKDGSYADVSILALIRLKRPVDKGEEISSLLAKDNLVYNNVKKLVVKLSDNIEELPEHIKKIVPHLKKELSVAEKEGAVKNDEFDDIMRAYEESTPEQIKASRARIQVPKKDKSPEKKGGMGMNN